MFSHAKQLAYLKEKFNAVLTSGKLNLIQIQELKRTNAYAFSALKNNSVSQLVLVGKLTLGHLQSFTHTNSLVFNNLRLCLLVSEGKIKIDEALALSLPQLERITYEPTFQALQKGTCTFEDAINRQLPNVVSENNEHYQASI